MAGINQGMPEVAVGEPVTLGSNDEYELEQDPVSDKLIVHDTVNNTEAYLRPETSQGLGQEGAFLRSLINGKPLADDGRTYATVQEAEQAANGWMFVPPGTFAENVTVDTEGLTITGAGYGTFIDGGTSGHGIHIKENNVTVQDLSAATTSGNTADYEPVVSQGATTTVQNVVVRDADDNGIRLLEKDAMAINCRVTSADGAGIKVEAGGIVAGCAIKSADFGINTQNEGHILSNNVITGSGTDGINLNSPDNIVIGNRIHNSGDNGLQVGSKADNIVANNRISGSTNSDLLDNGTGTLLDANVTGLAN